MLMNCDVLSPRQSVISRVEHNLFIPYIRTQSQLLQEIKVCSFSHCVIVAFNVGMLLVTVRKNHAGSFFADLGSARNYVRQMNLKLSLC